jgi:hypothetical protein
VRVIPETLATKITQPVPASPVQLKVTVWLVAEARAFAIQTLSVSALPLRTAFPMKVKVSPVEPETDPVTVEAVTDVNTTSRSFAAGVNAPEV